MRRSDLVVASSARTGGCAVAYTRFPASNVYVSDVNFCRGLQAISGSSHRKYCSAYRSMTARPSSAPQRALTASRFLPPPLSPLAFSSFLAFRLRHIHMYRPYKTKQPHRFCTSRTSSYPTGTWTIAGPSWRTPASVRCRRARRRSTTWARSWLWAWKRCAAGGGLYSRTRSWNGFIFRRLAAGVQSKSLHANHSCWSYR